MTLQIELKQSRRTLAPAPRRPQGQRETWRRLFLAAVFSLASLFMHAGMCRAQAVCVGDCGGGGSVSIGDIIVMVRLALTGGTAGCTAGDANLDGKITVSEILQAVNNALQGCPEAIARTPTWTATPTPTATLLQGTPAVEVIPRVVMATVDGIEILNFGPVGANVTSSSAAVSRANFRLRSMVGGASLRTNGSGGNGGCPAVSCTTDRSTSTETTTYANYLSTTAAGHTVVRNGTARVQVSDPNYCATHVVPAAASVTVSLSGFTLTETVGRTPIAQLSADIADTFVPAGASCGDNLSGTDTVNGTQTVMCVVGAAAQAIPCPANGIDVALTAQGLQLERLFQPIGTQTDGTPLCALRVTAQGEMDLSDRASGEHFAESFAGTQLTEYPGANGQSAFKIEGPLSVGCLGTVLLQTHAPLQMAPGDKCPGAGILQVAAPLPTAAVGGPTASEMRSAAPVVAASASGPAKVSEINGLRQAVYHAADGTVYQVLQNLNADADSGAEAFQVTTLVGAADAGPCSYVAGGTFDAEAVVGALSGQVLDPALVVTSGTIGDTTPPCFDAQGNGGSGTLCVGIGYTDACACPPGASCTAFAVGMGASLRDGAAGIPGGQALSIPVTQLGPGCSGFANAAAYGFGASGPTLDAPLCAAAPPDGFRLERGMSAILAYKAPQATRFTVGYGGFPIDEDGNNPFMCPANSVLGSGEAQTLFTLPPPMIAFGSGGGVSFDFNQDGQVDSTAGSCADAALLVCGSAPVATPTPNPSITPIALGTPAMVTTTGTTANGTNAFGGASCGLGGDAAPDQAFTYTAGASGTYTIDTFRSTFDTLLSVRDASTGKELACNDDASPGVGQSQVTVTLTAGQSVLIIVDGYGDASGAFTLHVAFTGIPPTPTPTPSPGLPDLVVTLLQAPTTATPGQPITVAVTVQNRGSGAAGGFQVGLQYTPSGATAGVDGGVACSVAGLAAGDTMTCTQRVAVPSHLLPGAYALTAIADAGNQVVESDETNNARVADTGPLTLSGPYWQSVGPYGGDVTAMAIDPTAPTTLYAGTRGGVFKSTDGGASWAPMNVGLSHLGIAALAINPTTPTTLYAGTLNGGVFMSSDGAANWAPMNTGLSDLIIYTLAIDSTTPSILYAGTSRSGVFKSTDGGASWAPMNAGLLNLNVVALAIDPTTPTTLYAGTGGGVFESTDGAVSWAPMNVGLSNQNVSTLAIDPTTPTTLYAGTQRGVFKSADGAASWVPINAGLSNHWTVPSSWGVA
jgi:CARDB